MPDTKTRTSVIPKHFIIILFPEKFPIQNEKNTILGKNSTTPLPHAYTQLHTPTHTLFTCVYTQKQILQQNKKPHIIEKTLKNT